MNVTALTPRFGQIRVENGELSRSLQVLQTQFKPLVDAFDDWGMDFCFDKKNTACITAQNGSLFHWYSSHPVKPQIKVYNPSSNGPQALLMLFQVALNEIATLLNVNNNMDLNGLKVAFEQMGVQFFVPKGGGSIFVKGQHGTGVFKYSSQDVISQVKFVYQPDRFHPKNLLALMHEGLNLMQAQVGQNTDG